MKKLCAIALTFLLTACSSSADETFVGKTYKMADAPNGAEITMRFDPTDKRIAGRAAVNRYFSAYELDGNKITFKNPGSTMMMGPDALMKAEAEYLKTLPTIVSYTLKGKTLVFKTSGDKLLTFEEKEEPQE